MLAQHFMQLLVKAVVLELADLAVEAVAILACLLLQ
jgi:hypothetical protein